MTRVITAAALILMSAAPAFAGCWVADAQDAMLFLPKVAFCVGGKCEEATRAYECDNNEGVQIGLSNGWKFAYSGTAIMARSPAGREMTDLSGITCYQSAADTHSCPRLR